MYETIKKFLSEGGKCLLIENGKPIGVVLTMEEYELLRGKPQVSNSKSQINPEAEKLIMLETEFPTLSSQVEEIHPVRNSPPQWPSGRASAGAISNGVDFPSASADPFDINLADTGDVTLEDLGLDELP
ncbi:MAG: hypothetical protein HYV51_03095 [Parcubacteria group bacterium]|nr:hypothetical protein [Parcubacteria group bacterium]